MNDVNDEIDDLINIYNESVEFEYAMETYDAIADELQNRVDNGELTLEDAEILNNLAYDRYYTERDTELLYNRGSKHEQYLRSVDVLKSQLKKKKITQEEYNKKIKDIDEKFKNEKRKIHSYGTIADKTIFSDDKKGVEDIHAAIKQRKKEIEKRPNKIDISDKKSKIKLTSSSIKGDGLSKDEMEKIKYLYDKCKISDDEKEYKQAFKVLKRTLNIPNHPHFSEVSLGQMRTWDGGGFEIQLIQNSKDYLKNDEIKSLYHTSPLKNQNEIQGTYRSRDGILHPKKRIYFGNGEMIDSNGIKRDNLNTYVPIKKQDRVHNDTEISNSMTGPISTYINADKIKVKKIN